MYLVFKKDIPFGVKIGDGSFLSAVPCVEGYWVDVRHKSVCDENKLIDYTIEESITQMPNEIL